MPRRLGRLRDRASAAAVAEQPGERTHHRGSAWHRGGPVQPWMSLGEFLYGANFFGEYMDIIDMWWIYGYIYGSYMDYLWMSLGLPIQLWCMADLT